MSIVQQELKTISNYIDGKLVKPSGDEYLDCYNPARGEVYARVPQSEEKEVEDAVRVAKKAFPSWSITSLEERHEYLVNISELILRDLDKLALAESIDNGKPLSLAKTVDIPRAAANFKFFATAIMHFAAESHAMPGIAMNYTLRRPLGVVGCISPWNLPLYLFSWKVAPALAAGNCVVAKPPQITPMTAFLLAELCIEAGLPQGVLNILHGSGSKVGEPLVKHPDVKAISFTGGTKTGARISQLVAPMFKKLSLELGGKNPNIIFADCNYEEMLETTIRSSFTNQGQVCLCGSRIFVEEPLYEKFKEDFVEKVEQLKVGDPLDKETVIGALVSQEHMQSVLDYIDLAKEEGGTILCGGKQIKVHGECEKGWFVEPTVVEGLDPYCRTNQEEIFGPVVTLIPFQEEKEVIEHANSVRYGLSASIWTNNLTRAHQLAEEIEAGIVWINTWLLRDLRTPFGGMKDSGMGREGGWEALRFFTEPKNVCVRY